MNNFAQGDGKSYDRLAKEAMDYFKMSMAFQFPDSEWDEGQLETIEVGVLVGLNYFMMAAKDAGGVEELGAVLDKLEKHYDDNPV